MAKPDTSQRNDGATSARRDPPDAPARLGADAWAAAARRAITEFKDDNLQDWAAALICQFTSITNTHIGR